MKKTTLTITIFLLLCSTAFGQNKQDLSIDSMLRGYIYAQSSIIDTIALGDFGCIDNRPKIINEQLAIAGSGLLLKIDTTQTTTFRKKYNGFKLYIANKTDTIVRFNGTDGKLDVIAEVYYQGEWKPIECLPWSWCGESFHYLYLNQNEYWEFDIPKYTGEIKTKLRYKLILDKGKYVFSNEILTSINKGQLNNKEGHKTNGNQYCY